MLIHTDGWDFPEGGDAYDCVCVVNDEKAREILGSARCTFGDDVSYGPGPLRGNINDSDIKQPWAAVWVYVKSKGHAIDAQVKGMVVEERTSESERFYGVEGITNRKILAGEVQAPNGPASQLLEVLKAVEGNNRDSNQLPSFGKSPGDYVLEMSKDESKQ